MLKLNAILKEINDVPANRLEELYQFIHSLSSKTKQTGKRRKQIMAFAGAFSDMDKKSYADYITHLKKTRQGLFDRKVEL